jgi:hypothetical protein
VNSATEWAGSMFQVLEVVATLAGVAVAVVELMGGLLFKIIVLVRK